ncbi:MAG: FAD-dependent oxidoreductase [Clostridia bacterium]|nr:FAD-dependent oxidoreductase [Clostridia bacterium]
MRIDNVKLSPLAKEDELLSVAIKKSKIKPSKVKSFRVLKKSLDARDKNDIKFVYSVEISENEINDIDIKIPTVDKPKKVAVVGFGPCGIFCALYLARAGVKPIVFERGKSVEERQKSVNRLINDKNLDENSNIQFGEGGAGTFSDGKLNTGVSSPLIKTVLKELVRYGAPKDIEYLAKPHVGSDNLPKVVSAMRKEIIRLGGEVRFDSKVKDLIIKGDKVVGVKVNGNDIEVDDVVIAVGHSARDTFYMLNQNGFAMERKAFAMGVRIEHLKRDVDVCQYGEKFADILPSADYRLSSRKGTRGVFTFCMCPGGFVMPSTSEEEMVVTNGMSCYKRDGQNSNSAVLCEVYPEDFKDGILGGVELQRDLERLAYRSGGGDYFAPVQTYKDFLQGGVKTPFTRVKPTYSVGFTPFDLNNLLPKFMSENLKIGIEDMAKKLKCFNDGSAVLTGVETRSSSPVRVLRGEDGQSVNYKGAYPSGEGCGYAGGITSAAVDGIKTAFKIIEKYTGRKIEF